MNQLVEMRFNPVYMPGKAEKDPHVRFDELIFISAQKTYDLDVKFNAGQRVETIVHRVVCDEGGKVNTIVGLAQLLPEKHLLRAAIEQWIDAEAANVEKKRKSANDLFSQP